MLERATVHYCLCQSLQRVWPMLSGHVQFHPPSLQLDSADHFGEHLQTCQPPYSQERGETCFEGHVLAKQALPISQNFPSRK